MDPKKLKKKTFIFKEKQSELETVNQQLTGEQRQRHEDGEVIVKLKQVIVREMTQRGPPFCSICQSGFAPKPTITVHLAGNQRHVGRTEDSGKEGQCSREFAD